MSEEFVLSEAGPPRKRLKISLQEYEGTPLLQIRYFYEDKDGNLRPTKQGIAITRNRYLDIADAVQKNHELIADFLSGGVDGLSFESRLVKEKSAQAMVHSPVKKISVASERLRRSELFAVEFSGSLAKIVVNAEDGIFSEDAFKGEKSSGLFRALVALEMSAILVAEGESREVRATIERLMQEFKRQITNLSGVAFEGQN